MSNQVKSCLVVVYAALLISLIFIGANRSTLAAEKPKLNVWLYTELAEGAREYQLSLINQWAEINNVDVEVSAFGWSDLSTKLAAATAGRNEPDIAYPGAFNVLQSLQLDRLYPLDDIVEKMKALGSEFIPSVAEGTKLNGHFYCIPQGQSPEVFYIRKDWLEEKGLLLPETWDDFKVVAAKMSDPDNNIYGFGQALGGELWDAEKSFRILLWDFGGKLVEDDGKTIAFESEATIKTVEYLAELYREKIIPPDAVSWSSSDNNKAWLEGRAGSIINTGSVIWTMRQDYPEMLDKTYVMVPPAGPAARTSYAGAFCSGWTVFRSSKYPDLAKDLILYLMTPEHYTRFIELAEGTIIPVIEAGTHLPLWEDLMNKANIDCLRVSRTNGYSGPPTLAALEVFDTSVMTQMTGRVVVNGWTATEALKEAMTRIQEIYSKYYEY